MPKILKESLGSSGEVSEEFQRLSVILQNIPHNVIKPLTSLKTRKEFHKIFEDLVISFKEIGLTS